MNYTKEAKKYTHKGNVIALLGITVIALSYIAINAYMTVFAWIM